MANQTSVHPFHGDIAETDQQFFVPLIPAPLAGDLIERVSPRPGERVADVACGTGVVTRLAAGRVGPSGTVVGVDPSAEMLGVARTLPPPPGAAMDWRQASAERLPLTDRSCDVVFCQLALMPVTDRIAAVSEMHRVLAAEGRVAINVPGMMQPPFAIIGEALARHVKPALSRFVDAVFSMHDPAEMEHLLDDGGFTDVAVEVVSHSFRLGPPEEFLWSYINSTPLGVAVAEADPAKRDQVQDDVITAWQPFTEDGALILEQPIVVATGTTR